MSNQKRPGVRDISDLKARLGLKKKGGAPKRGAAAVPPPGVGGAVPAPPGAEPPKPQPSADPFGAMNAAAAQAAVQRAPEIVIVNDGKPVEQVNKKVKYIGYAKLAGVVLVPLIVGITVGQISRAAKTYNKTLADARKIAANVKEIRKGLSGLRNALLTGKEGGRYKVNDAKLTKALKDLKLVPPDINVAYGSYMYELPETTVAQVLEFYADTAKLYELVRAHVKATKNDAKSLIAVTEGRKAAIPENKLTPYRYGILLEVPKGKAAEAGKPPNAQLVELAAPICQGADKPSTTGECPGPPRGFRYRTGATGKWGAKELAAPSEQNLPAGKLIPLWPTGAMDGLVTGGKGSVAEMYYFRRVNELEEMVQRLIELGARVEDKLNAKGGEGDKFTFFL